MKFIRAFLAVCGLVAAQSSQAPDPVQPPTGNAARMAPAPETPTIAPGAVGDLPNEGGHEHDEQ
jgi:hypothetical protein